MTDPKDQRNMLGRMLSRPVGLTLCGAILLVIAGIDFSTQAITFPILYIIPLIIFSHTARTRGILWLAGLMVVLTFVKYLAIAPHRPSGPINRLMVCAMLFIGALILRHGRNLRDKWEKDFGPLADVTRQGSLLNRSFQSMERFLAVLLALLLILAIFMIDLFTTNEYNLPIFYLIPLVIVGLTCKPETTWVITLLLLVLSVAGYFLGPAAPDEVMKTYHFQLVLTRTLTSVAIIITAALVRRFKPSS